MKVSHRWERVGFEEPAELAGLTGDSEAEEVFGLEVEVRVGVGVGLGDVEGVRSTPRLYNRDMGFEYDEELEAEEGEEGCRCDAWVIAYVSRYRACRRD